MSQWRTWRCCKYSSPSATPNPKTIRESIPSLWSLSFIYWCRFLCILSMTSVPVVVPTYATMLGCLNKGKSFNSILKSDSVSGSFGFFMATLASPSYTSPKWPSPNFDPVETQRVLSVRSDKTCGGIGSANLSLINSASNANVREITLSCSWGCLEWIPRSCL